MIKNSILIPLLFLTAFASAQRLKAPPTLSHVTQESVTIWLAAKGHGPLHGVLRVPGTDSIIQPRVFRLLENENGIVSLSATYVGLKPDSEYIFELAYEQRLKMTVRTEQVYTDSSDIEFLAGSCFFIPNSAWKYIIPGRSIRILKKMISEDPDFMLWMGDNLYYVGADFTSFEEMFRRQLQMRRNGKLIRKLLQDQPNYSIWDDHDFGANNSNGTFPLKDSSLIIHRSFWPNPYPEKTVGSYYTFTKGDAQFFMLDGRYFRSERDKETRVMFGDEQIEWLRNELLNSTAKFKFIASGSQILSDIFHTEFFAYYPEERQALFDFIVDRSITGVIFLSGDRHFSELTKKEYRNRTFYEVTSSPVLSFPNRISKRRNTFDPQRVEESLVDVRNYSKIKISGTKRNRKCTIAIISKRGKKKFEYSIPFQELE